MTVNAAIAQFAPEVLDLKRSVKKACDIIARAKKEDVQLLAFPETWIPTYPVWADMGTYSQWGNEPSKRLFRRLYENSLKIGSAEFRSLSAACRKARMHVVIGVNEQAGRSIYNSLLFFGSDGKLMNHHRKLVPTFGERLVWAHGDADGLRTIETPFGTIGGLICWEHWMPNARQVLHDGGELIHVAAWPHGKEMHQVASRHYAFEGRCFVLAAGMYLERDMFPRDYELREELKPLPKILIPGGSSIIGPDGSFIVEPVMNKEELIVAAIEPLRAQEENITLDVSGHYSRPDIFDLTVRRHRKDG